LAHKSSNSSLNLLSAFGFSGETFCYSDFCPAPRFVGKTGAGFSLSGFSFFCSPVVIGVGNGVTPAGGAGGRGLTGFSAAGADGSGGSGGFGGLTFGAAVCLGGWVVGVSGAETDAGAVFCSSGLAPVSKLVGNGFSGATGVSAAGFAPVSIFVANGCCA